MSKLREQELNVLISLTINPRNPNSNSLSNIWEEHGKEMTYNNYMIFMNKINKLEVEESLVQNILSKIPDIFDNINKNDINLIITFLENNK